MSRVQQPGSPTPERDADPIDRRPQLGSRHPRRPAVGGDRGAVAEGARQAPAGPSVRTLVDGVASDWDAGRRLVSLDAPDVSKGSKALRRAVKRGVTITQKVTGGTRLIAVDADGHRARIAPAEPFDELDLAEDEVDVEASGRVPRVVRPAADLPVGDDPIDDEDLGEDLGEDS
jgi:hypothetical protein